MIRQRRQQTQRQRISPKLKLTLFSSGIFVMAAVTLIIYSNTGLQLNAVAGPGMTGDGSFTTGQTVVNEFTAITSDVKAGSTQINVADNTLNTHTRFAGNLHAGELVLIVQMQIGPKNYIDLNEEKEITDEAGKYEFAEVAGVEEGPKINFTASLKNSYAANGKTQVVRVPRYNALNIVKNATITTDTWNGNTGGIAAVEVNGNARVNGMIDVTGKGFNEKAFQKLLKSAAVSRKETIATDSAGSRIYFGSASINKALKTQSSGGGIVFLIVNGTLEGTGGIHADGSSVVPGSEVQANGGQGGSVYICAREAAGSITITTKGGNALQQVDSMDQTSIRGMGGEGGIIRSGSINSFKCSAEGGMNTPVRTETGITDSAKAASGIVCASNMNPYSKNSVSTTKLEFFAATYLKENINVSWVTTSEEDVDYFTVEKSINGDPFIAVFKVNGKGNSGIENVYHFEDAAQSSGDFQYRLIQTNHDNRQEIYPAVKVKQKEKAGETKLISCQPNPFGDQLTIQCTIAEPGIIDISLTDISGNVVRKQSAVTGEGMNTLSMTNLSDIPKGTYFISFSTADQKMTTIKVMK